MGVDYTANYGLGVEISTKHKLVGEDEGYEDILLFLDKNLNGKYEYFEEGAGSYTGEENFVYVVLKRGLACGIDKLEAEKEALLKHLKELDVEVLSEFDVVGGLLVW